MELKKLSYTDQLQVGFPARETISQHEKVHVLSVVLFEPNQNRFRLVFFYHLKISTCIYFTLYYSFFERTISNGIEYKYLQIIYFWFISVCQTTKTHVAHEVIFFMWLFFSRHTLIEVSSSNFIISHGKIRYLMLVPNPTLNAALSLSLQGGKVRIWITTT